MPIRSARRSTTSARTASRCYPITPRPGRSPTRNEPRHVLDEEIELIEVDPVPGRRDADPTRTMAIEQLATRDADPIGHARDVQRRHSQRGQSRCKRLADAERDEILSLTMKPVRRREAHRRVITA